jgi:tripartite ATP-independent transporter DctM subunit
MVLLLLLSFVILCIASMPISFALGISTALALTLFTDIPLIVIPQRIIAGYDSFTLLAVPLFILVGSIMSRGGIANRLLNLANILIGHVRGGLAHATIIASLFFGSVSGSALADVAAIGGLVIPAMVKEKYDRAFAVIVVACSSPLSPIIPPSIIMIIYGWLTETSVPALFAGGFIPGIIISAALIAISYYYSVKYNYPVKPRAHFGQFLKAFVSSIPPLLTPVIILAGILSGIFTPTEAAAVALFYGLFLTGIVYRELSLSSLFTSLVETAVLTGAIMLIFGMASGFAWLLISQQVPQMVSNFIISISGNKYMFLLYINILYFIVGLFLTPTPAMIIFLPLLIPAAVSLGINLVHFGMIMVFTLSIGLLTPPVGPCLFAACSIGKIDVSKVMKLFIPYLVVLILVTLLITYVPWFTLVVPKMLRLIR